MSFCTDDTEWTFVGDSIFRKEIVRRRITAEYIEPPENNIARLIAEDDFVTAIGDLTLKDENGNSSHY